MNRGDQRERILSTRRIATVSGDAGRSLREDRMAIHAFYLMSTHFHLVETPRRQSVRGHAVVPELTGRYNRQHRLFGHLFSGRFNT
jgi:hypothetical protein